MQFNKDGSRKKEKYTNVTFIIIKYTYNLQTTYFK